MTERIKSLLMPVLVLMLAVLSVVGIMRVLNTEQSVDRLILDLESPQFGNKWAAAYELSKNLVGKEFSQRESNRIAQKLVESYNRMDDTRAKKFILLAIGHFKRLEDQSFFESVLKKEEDKDLLFYSTLGLSQQADYRPSKVILPLLKETDKELLQLTLLLLTRRPELLKNSLLEEFLENSQLGIKNIAFVHVIIKKQIKFYERLKQHYTVASIEEKLNIIKAIEKYPDKYWGPFLKECEEQAEHPGLLSALRNIKK